MPLSASWAARYQFLEELWRGQPRILLDPELEHAVATAGPGFAHRSPPTLAALANELLPRSAGGPPTWCVVQEVSPEHLQRDRPGTRFITVSALPELMARQRFEVACLDLRALLDDESTATGIGRGGGEVEDRFGPLGTAVMQALSVAATALRTLVLTAPLQGTGGGPGFSYDEVAQICARLGGGRIFALFDAPMLAVAEYGEPIEPDEGVDDGEDELVYDEGEGDEDEEPPLSFDNSLADEEPRLTALVAIIGAPEFMAEGLTLVELPAVSEDAEADGAASVRAQLAQARRQADLSEIARQQLFATVEELREDNARLAAELDALTARGLDDEVPLPSEHRPEVRALQEVEGGPRVDAESAEVLELRLRMAQLEEEVDVLRRRPVSELEAELAAARARLLAAGEDPSPGGASSPSSDREETPPAVPRGRGDGFVEATLERLVARLERDESLTAGDVRRTLQLVRERLR